MDNSELALKDTFRIGAVARLTGLTTHTLRKWESRYEAVVPQRSERGERLYSRADVQRLSMIKRLVDAGVAPRDVARLTIADLTQKTGNLVEAQALGGNEQAISLRVAVVGSTIGITLDRQADALSRSLESDSFKIVARSLTETDFEELEIGKPVDLVVYECDTVHSDTRATLDRLIAHANARAGVVVHRFATRGDLLSLQSPTMATIRAPVALRTLEQVAAELVRPQRRGRGGAQFVAASGVDEVAKPRLSNEVIARVARSSPKLRCECPHHLADILLGLRAFEDYSAACESRNREDAALHNYLWRSAAQARALFEDAIERVATAEGISLSE